jgi:hypothetical protein
MTEGERLTAEILHAVAPVVNGHPIALVVDAMAAAMLAAVTIATPDIATQALMLRRFAALLEDIAERMSE